MNSPLFWVKLHPASVHFPIALFLLASTCGLLYLYLATTACVGHIDLAAHASRLCWLAPRHRQRLDLAEWSATASPLSSNPQLAHCHWVEPDRLLWWAALSTLALSSLDEETGAKDLGRGGERGKRTGRPQIRNTQHATRNSLTCSMILPRAGG